MKRTLVKMLSLLLALGMLLSACGTGTVETSAPGEDNNTIAPVETESGGKPGPRLQPEWTKDAVIYEVNIRQYTEDGTFNAFAEHLQEIWDMGCNVLWFMPIHPISVVNRSGELGSYYSVADYCKVNPEFGTEEDFAALVEKAHDTLNFLDNHDKNSYEGTIREHFSEEVLPSMFALTYTIPGVPLVYTGDEIGLDHALAFMSKDPVDWNSSETSYRELLAALSDIRSGNEALYAGNYGGSIEYLDAGGNDRYIFAFAREKDGNRIKTVFNLNKKEQEVDLSGWLTGNETVLMHGIGADVDLEEHPISDEGLTVTTTLAPWEFYIVRE